MIDEWNIDADRIFLLPADWGGIGEVTLEDLLVPDVYKAAAVAQIEPWNDRLDFSDLELPDRARSAAVKTWSTGKGVPPPGKNAVAGRVLDARRNEKDCSTVDLVSETFRLPLRELYLALIDGLGIVSETS
jgi:hypothetical protein